MHEDREGVAIVGMSATDGFLPNYCQLKPATRHHCALNSGRRLIEKDAMMTLRRIIDAMAPCQVMHINVLQGVSLWGVNSVAKADRCDCCVNILDEEKKQKRCNQ